MKKGGARKLGQELRMSCQGCQVTEQGGESMGEVESLEVIEGKKRSPLIMKVTQNQLTVLSTTLV